MKVGECRLQAAHTALNSCFVSMKQLTVIPSSPTLPGCAAVPPSEMFVTADNHNSTMHTGMRDNGVKVACPVRKQFDINFDGQTRTEAGCIKLILKVGRTT